VIELDRDNLVLVGISILVIVIILVFIFAFSGNNTFDSNKVSFQYPAGWSQNSMVGSFSNTSLYSEVTLTSSITDTNGSTQTAYIIVQMQQKPQGVINLPSTSSLVSNTTNSSVSSLSVGNFTATQLGSAGNNMVERVTIIDVNNNYLVVTLITPPYALNQTGEAYNTILKTLKIS
jgi:hypothetical protein